MQIGMKVYDNDRRHIGMVDDFQFAENAVTEDGNSTAAGLLDGDRYVPPEEIASASGLELTLNLGKDQLLRTQ